MEILLISVGVLVVCIGMLIAFIVPLMKPTKGPEIQKYTDPQKALFVIDVQEDYTGRTAKSPYPYKNSGELINSINSVIGKASENGFIVVYIRQEFDGFSGKAISAIFGGGTAVRGKPGTEIDARISFINGNIFPKPRSDAFSNPELEKFLEEQRVDEIFLTGLDAQFCVFQTARGALNRGYRVHAVTDCVALRAEKKWDMLMEKYKRYGILLTSGSHMYD